MNRAAAKKNMTKKAARSVRITPAHVAAKHKETIEWARKFIAKYRPALEALADK